MPLFTIDNKYEIKETLYKSKDSLLLLAFDTLKSTEVYLRVILFPETTTENCWKQILAYYRNCYLWLQQLACPGVEVATDFGHIILKSTFTSLSYDARACYFATSVGNKKHLLSQSTQDVTKIVHYISKVLEILPLLHGKKIFHCNLSPYSIAIDTNDNITLLDVGITPLGFNCINSSCYVAPELTCYYEYNACCDIYSIGMTLYKTISGTLYNQNEPQDDILKKLDPFLSKIIRESTQTNPQNRISLPQIINYFEEFSGKSLSVSENLAYLKPSLIANSVVREKLQAILSRISRQSKKPPQTLAFLVEGAAGEGKSRFISEVKIVSHNHKVKCCLIPLRRKNSNAIILFSKILKSLQLADFLFPELDTDSISLYTHFSQKERYFQTKEKIAQAIINYTRKTPLVLLFDDFHFADKITVDILKHIWQKTKHESKDRKHFPRLFMVLTYVTPKKTDPLFSFFNEQIYNDDIKNQIIPLELTSFSLEETGQCISNVLNMDNVPQNFSTLLFKASKGNKLHIMETLRSMLKKGSLYVEKGEWCVDDENLNLPQSLDSAISYHLETLPALCEKILKSIALLQNPLPVGIIFEVLQVSETELISALHYLVTSSIIIISEEFTIDFYNTKTASYFENKIKKNNDICNLLKIIENLNEDKYNFLLASFDCSRQLKHVQKSLYYLVANGLTIHEQKLTSTYCSFLKKSQKNSTWFAEIYFLLGEKKESEKLYSKIVKSSPSVFSYLRLAKLLCEKENIKNAECMLKQAKEILSQNKTIITLDCALYYFVKSHIMYAKAKIDKAIIALQKSLYYIIDNFDQINNKKLAITFYCKILEFSDIWEYSSYIDNFLHRGQKLAQALNDAYSLAFFSRLLGEKYKMEANYSKAIESYQQSLGLWEQINNPYQEAKCLLGLSKVLIAIGDDKVEELLDKVFKISIENKMEILIANCYFTKSSHLIFKKQREEAEIYIDKAIDIFSRKKAYPQMCLALCQLVELTIIDGNQEEIKKYLNKAEKISKNIKWPRLKVAVEILKAMYYKEQDPKKTTSILDNILEICQNFKLNEYLLQIYYEYGNALRSQGKIQDALEKYRQAKQLVQSCINELPQEKIESFYNTTIAKSLEKMLNMLTTELPLKSEKDYPDMISSYEKSMEMEHLNALQTENSNLQKLLEINKKLLQEHNIKKLLNFIMDVAIELTKAERGFIILRDTSKEKAFEVARNFEKEHVLNPEFEVSNSITEQVIKTGLPILSENAMEDERFSGYRSVTELNLYSILAVPLVSQEKILGAVYIDNRFEKSVFSQKEKNLLSSFAIQAALAIENARLLQENIEKQKKIESFNKKLGQLNSKLSKKVESQQEELSDVKLILHQNKQDLASKYSYRNIIGKSQKIQDLFNIIDKISDKNIPVLIQGESGTGKELVARAIHFNSQRNKENFMSENCAAISDSLLENELFGHEKGAYTNAYNDKKGLFELADKGSLFLDEVGDMSTNMQVKLLRVLENNRIRRVGGKEEIQVNVRIISASNKILEDLVEEQTFRADLFFRLKVVQVDLPPLRERKEDIPLLVSHFLKMFAKENQTGMRKVSKKGMKNLVEYYWPGNIRELKNVLYNVLSIYDEYELTDTHFAELTKNPSQKVKNIFFQELSIEEYAKGFVLQNQGKYNDSQLAKILGFSRKTLWEKRKKWSIVRE